MPDNSNNTAAENEPGIDKFNVKNFEDILKLIEDPSYGKTPNYSVLNKSAIDKIEARLKEHNLYELISNSEEIEEELINGILSQRTINLLSYILKPQNKSVVTEGKTLLDDFLAIYPRIQLVIDAFVALVDYQWTSLGGESADNTVLQNEYLKAFGKGFKWAFDFHGTAEQVNQQVNKWFKERINDLAPETVNPWELRIGASRFFVPPVNINVAQGFKVGSLSGSALRQQNSPKFNSGHSETTIDMTLYFPTHESIWGYSGRGGYEINFDKDDDAVIDKFISSLRGLITQFKYTPFLPVRNDYLNRTYGITGVALHSMTIGTVPNYPFCLAVNLHLLEFNHKVYLPPIDDFNQAIHWGRYRQYVGRAAQKLNSIVNEGFLIEEIQEADKKTNSDDDDANTVSSIIKYEAEPTLTFDKLRDFRVGQHFDIYFPKKTPGRIFAPDVADFRQDGEDVDHQRDKNAWEAFMQRLGIDVDTNPESYYDEIENNKTAIFSRPSERDKLQAFLKTFGEFADVMTKGRLDEFIEQQYAAANKIQPGINKEQYSSDIKRIWFGYMAEQWKFSPFFQQYLANADFADGQYLIKEWMIPMDKMEVNWKNVIVQGINVTMSNNLVRMQLQMQEEPTHQHIGGGDSQIDVSMVVFGEDDLIRFRRVFQHINNLARIEQAHGTLGFLGIKNVVSSLAGIKYVLPLAFEVDTVPGYPHVYQVRMSFVDFDVMQQKREQISTAQQKQLVDSFGKRNPFLRIKQLWGAFNAYPDFPLSVKDENGNIIGHLDPDFYFRAFQTMDDDIAYWGLEQSNLHTSMLSREDSERVKQIQDTLDSKTVLSTDQRKKLEDELADILAKGDTSEAIDRGGVNYEDQETISSKEVLRDHRVVWTIGTNNEEQNQSSVITICKDGLEYGTASHTEGEVVTHVKAKLLDNQAAEVLTTNSINGLTPCGEYQHHHADGSADPTKHWELMMTDAQYRDISGRMIRAFPTYMLWLIDEGGRFAGVKLFDNFYGLQSIIDFSVSRSEDPLTDTLVLRVSNLYKRLTTSYKGYIFRDQGSDFEPGPYDFVDNYIDKQRNIESGTNDSYIVDLDHIRLKPGVRVHLRMGFSSNPNALDTVFNGVVTEVRAGDIVEVVAQSDAVELSPIVNSTSKSGHSGKIDGAVNTGLFLSEPRDLMVRLLSMGSSTFKESFAHATQGMIFSDNKFGIRHFGQILYEPLSEEENEKHEKRFNVVKHLLDSFTSADPRSPNDLASVPAEAVGSVDPYAGTWDLAVGNAATRNPITAVVQSMYTNFYRNRDYELFKRNIYPGNGLGIAQYLGGDTLDGGAALADAALNSTDALNAASHAGVQTGQYDQTIKNASIVEAWQSAHGVATDDAKDGHGNSTIETVNNTAANINILQPSPQAYRLLRLFDGKDNDSPILQALGGASQLEDDVSGFDEVSFRAQTHMKSVWDLFQTCAALLPNYIVAVRPFEDRSTVFYGKPHWMYTSGVIPITTGVPKQSDDVKTSLPDAELAKLVAKVMNAANAYSDFETQLGFFAKAGEVNPYTSTKGVVWEGGDVNALPANHPNGGVIPFKSGGVSMEMHLPTSNNLETDKHQHLQLDSLPKEIRHPYYMDRSSDGTASGSQGGVGGVNGNNPYSADGTIKQGDNPNWPGRAGAFGFLDPLAEQWYIVTRWTTTSGIENYQSKLKGTKILVYADKTSKAIVCTPGDYGPNKRIFDGGRKFGLSPDAMHTLGISIDDTIRVGFVDDDTPLGPTSGTPVSVGAAIGGSASATSGQLRTGDTSITNAAMALTVEDIRSFESNALMSSPGDITNKGILDELKKSIIDRSDWQEKYDIDDTIDKAEDNFQYSIPDEIAANATSHFAKYAYEYGAIDTDIPVWIAPYKKDLLGTQEIDYVGIAARRLYDKDYNKAFTGLGDTSFQSYSSSQLAFDVGSNFKDANGTTKSGGRNLAQAADIWREFRSSSSGFRTFNWAENDTFERLANGELKNSNGEPLPKSDKKSRSEIERYLQSFMRFMWQEPYARAWLVMTTNHRVSVSTNGIVVEDPSFSLKEGVGGSIGFEGLGNHDDWDFDEGPLQELFELFVVTVDLDRFDSRETVSKGGVVLGEYKPDAKKMRDDLLGWMRDHNTQGLDSGNILSRIGEEVKNTYDATIGRIWSAIASNLSSLVALYRISMAQLGQGLSEVHNMQRQANILNKVFNDSIYYSAGSPGSILRLADNPFTREYGEPVIEVREPFQRVHYVDSWQHILSNNITENTTDVATVITAVSDGQYPVTAYFDRGAAPERQIEDVVETGLYWDNAKGSGFFAMLHPLLHPVEATRGNVKDASGASDEILSKRVALYHLKESLKNIYTGEVVILGNPSIRPHDLIYIADVYSRVYGLCEVEQVVHHFTPDMGFITSITPNALVTINDPSRWSMLSWVRSLLGVKNLRDDTKYTLSNRGINNTQLSRTGITLDELAASLSTQLEGHVQYANGNSALIRDLASGAAMGNFGDPNIANADILKNQEKHRGSTVTSNINDYTNPGQALIKDALSPITKWVRDNLFDQQGCYISYLTKDGQAMDAGLSYNQGVAVGSHHTIELLPGILGLKIPVIRDGHKRITYNDLMESLGWNEIEVSKIQKEVSFWVARTNAEILKVSGLSPDLLPFSSTKPHVQIVHVKGDDAYFDGDTFSSTDGRSWRLAGLQAAEVAHNYTESPDGIPVDETYARNHIAYSAAAYLKKRLYTDPMEQYGRATVAVRMGVNTKTYNRTAAVVFHNVPEGTPTGVNPESGIHYRDEFLKAAAEKWPLTEWDQYMDDGRPYTINWEMVSAGLAQTILFGNTFDTDRGALGLGRGG